MADINEKTYYICMDQWWLKTAKPEDRWEWLKKNLKKVYGLQLTNLLIAADKDWETKKSNLYVLLPPIAVAFVMTIAKIVGDGALSTKAFGSNTIWFNIVEQYALGKHNLGVDLNVSDIGKFEFIHGVTAFHPNSLPIWIDEYINEMEMPDNWTGNFLISP